MYSMLGASYLGNTGVSSKIDKTTEVLDIETYCMYLAPSTLSGYNVCPMATKECIEGCLNTSGRMKMNTSYNIITKARMAKTKMLFEHRDIFMQMLVREIALKANHFKKLGKKFAVRLNGTSDLNPTYYFKDSTGKNILDYFPDVQFYDYTKVSKHIEIAKKYANYDLTFSYTGMNWDSCKYALENGVRVAVVFNSKELPKFYKGIEVINGDLYDYRPIDPKKCIVGLKWKSIRDKQSNERVSKSVFVVQPTDSEVTW